MPTVRYIVPDGPEQGREFEVLSGELFDTIRFKDDGEVRDYSRAFADRCKVMEPRPATEIGRKDDSTKPTWRLLYTFIPELNGVARVLEFGAKKYAPENWKLVPDAFNRYGEAGRRHLMDSLAGEEIDGGDKGSGEYHELSVIVCMLFRLAARRMGLK